MSITAFDIGGTALKMGVVDADGQIQEKGKTAIVDSDGEQILYAMLDWVISHPQCAGIAISAPGYVNPQTGYIEMGGAIRRFDNFAMKAWLEEKTALPVTVENDANCVLLAERWLGKAANMNDFLVLTIGTGIGGAIFCNGNLVHGKRFRAGEFGYMLTDRPASRHVTNYTMNTTCTLRVLRKRYADSLGQPLDAVTGEAIFDAYESGERSAQRLVDDFLNGIASGLYNLVNLFDPETIFIGGGIIERPGFLALLRDHLRWFGIDEYVRPASQGNDAGLLGAVYHFNQQNTTV